MMWDLPGGRLNWGEQPRVGVKREVLEELCIDIEPLAVFDAVAFVGLSGRPHLAVIHLCERTHPSQEIMKQEEEISQFRWISEEELEEVPMLPEYRKVLRRRFAELKEAKR